jgi:transcriptional regulator with XRE-family HTH domain
MNFFPFVFGSVRDRIVSRYRFIIELCEFTLQEKKITFEKKLESIRVKHGMEWQDLAKALDIGKTMLHYIKTGQREPSQKVLRKIEILENCEPGVNPIYAQGPVFDLKTLADGPTTELYQTGLPPKPRKIEDRLETMEKQLADVLSELRKMNK